MNDVLAKALGEYERVSNLDTLNYDAINEIAKHCGPGLHNVSSVLRRACTKIDPRSTWNLLWKHTRKDALSQYDDLMTAITRPANQSDKRLLLQAAWMNHPVISSRDWEESSFCQTAIRHIDEAVREKMPIKEKDYRQLLSWALANGFALEKPSRIKMRQIYIPDGVGTIGASAFEDCSALTSVELPPSVKHIEERAFCNCRNLKAINLDNVKGVNKNAFHNCSSLKVSLPDTLVHIGTDAFSGIECATSESQETNKLLTASGYGNSPSYAIPLTIHRS